MNAAGGSFVALRRHHREQAFGRLVETAADLAQHLQGVHVAAEQVQLVQQCEDQNAAGQDVQVERLDPEFTVVCGIDDRLDVLTRVKARPQHRREVDHADRLLIGAVGD